MDLREYHPRPSLVVKTNQITQPKFPVIDAHNHIFDQSWLKRPVSEFLELLDFSRIQTYVDLDGGWGEQVLYDHLDHFKFSAPERFVCFGGVDWSAWSEKGDRFPEWAAERLRIQASRGAQGLKIWKTFGLKVMDHLGQLVRVDDPRLDPIWQAAGELVLPVIIHVADPVAFFDPLDKYNERWEELIEHPDWHFPSPPYPSFLSILNGLAQLVRRHPKVIFIGAHVGCFSENLEWVGNLLDECPNFSVDIGARINELGRQPYSARRFFQKYADRILFGTDAGRNPDYYHIDYRFLETEDEYFMYNPGDIPGQGRWNIYGIHLPEEILKKIYFSNANRIILKNE